MPQRPDAILVVTPGFPADEQDHNCLPFHQALLKAMRVAVHPCRLVVLSLHYPFRRGSYDWHGIEVIALGGQNRGGLYRFGLERRAARCLQDLHQHYRFAAVLSCWHGQAAYVAQQYSKRYAVPHRVYLMGQDAREFNPYPARMRLPAETLVAISDEVADAFARHHGVRPAHRVYPGVEKLGSSCEKERLILAAGSLIPLKRFEWVMELARLTKEVLPDYRWMIAGKGPERAELEALIGRYGLQDRVALVGALPHGDLRALMARAALFLHPSAYEGFPGVCLEALAAGTPVISVCRPLHAPLPGWVYVDDLQEMREAMLKVLSDERCEVALPEGFYITATARRMVDCLIAGSSINGVDVGKPFLISPL